MYRHNDGLYFCSMGEEVLLFHEERQEYFKLNGPGAAIWRLLSEPNSVDGIVTQLSQEFVIDDDTCRSDVQEFVSELIKNNFIVSA